MITEKDLQEAIAECEGQRNPNANTCIKLAAFYTIRQHMFGQPTETYSFASAGSVEKSETAVIKYNSGSEFAKLAYGVNIVDLMPIMDELMETISITNPRLYSGVLRKMEDISIQPPSDIVSS